MPRLWVGGAEAEIDARSTYFKREKGRTTHCIHSDFIIKTSFTKFVNMFSFFQAHDEKGLSSINVLFGNI